MTNDSSAFVVGIGISHFQISFSCTTQIKMAQKLIIVELQNLLNTFTRSMDSEFLEHNYLLGKYDYNKSLWLKKQSEISHRHCLRCQWC